MTKTLTELTVIENSKKYKEINNNADKAIKFANELNVTTSQALNKATTSLAVIVQRIKQTEEQRKFFVQPLNDHVGRINQLFKPTRDKYQEAEKTIKRKMVGYHQKQQEKARREQEKLAKQIKEKKIDMEKAVTRAEKIDEPETTTRTDEGAKATFRTRKVLVIEDEKKLPRAYLVPDNAKITKALRAGVQVPGAKLEEIQEVASGGIMF